jgi:uncharacterized membrane protein
MTGVVQVVACVLLPALALWLAARSKVVKTVGPVVVCYAVGLIVANAPGVHLDAKTSENVASVAVPLAIPLLLFGSDVRAWLKLARPLLLSFVIACVAAVLSAGAVAWVFQKLTPDWWRIAGMLVGVYVGGTANMSAVGQALGASSEVFVLVSGADLMAGGAWLLVLLTVAQRVLLLFMKPFAAAPHEGPFEHGDEGEASFTRKHLGRMAAALGLAAAMVGVSAGASWLTLHRVDAGLVFLLLTALGIGASFSPWVRALEGGEDVGEYSLLVFCVAMGAMADLRQLSGSSLVLFSLVACTMVLTIAVHVVLCRLAGLDADTTLIASTATIYGPPFVGPVAAALKNKALVGPGLAMGLAGIALGTPLGMATGWVLRWLAGQ